MGSFSVHHNHIILKCSPKGEGVIPIPQWDINFSIYSEIQKLWDINRDCKLNLILIGSIYSLMHKIFENNKEPLFGRADAILHLKPFKIKTLSKIFKRS